MIRIVYIPTETVSVEAQNILFRKGYRWASGDRRPLNGYGRSYFYLNEGGIICRQRERKPVLRDLGHTREYKYTSWEQMLALEDV